MNSSDRGPSKDFSSDLRSELPIHLRDIVIDRACGLCRFAMFVGTPLLECRRHAPIPSPKSYRLGGVCDPWWPNVNSGDWCGDFEHYRTTDGHLSGRLAEDPAPDAASGTNTLPSREKGE